MSRKTLVYLNSTALILLWIYSAWVFAGAPATIPVHFNRLSEPDNWGPRSFLFVLPGFATALCLLFFALSGRPHLLNVPASVNQPDERSIRQSRAAAGLLLVLLAVLFVFFVATALIWMTTHDLFPSLRVYTLPLSMLVMLVASAWIILSALRH